MTCADEVVRVKVRGRYHVDNPESVLPHWSPQTRFGNQITAMASPDRMRIMRNKELIDYVAQSNGSS